MSPSLDADGVPDYCLSLRIRSDWGHFRQVGRTATKQTYRVIPRTTVAGLLAAIVGAPRDSYYDVFAAEQSAIAITPLSELRTLNVPETVIGTDPDQQTTQTAGSRRSKALTYQDSTQPRQIHVYETLVDPEYRIDVAVEDAEFFTSLRDHLVAGTSHYPPSMGLSEHLATVELLETETEPTRVTADGPVTVDSAVPAGLDVTTPQPGVQYNVERSAATMEAIPGGRRTTRFDDLVYTSDPADSLKVDSSKLDRPVVDVGDATVVFR
jgi:CRISPR-associated protein Cas5h